jgi:hypothetical protein
MPDSSSAKTCRIESLAEQANAYPRSVSVGGTWGSHMSTMG